MPKFPWRLVTVDIDGTLTTVHGWREIAKASGWVPEYDLEHDRIDRGEVDEDTHLRRLFRLAVGLTQPQLEAVLEATPRLTGITSTVRALHRRGAKVGLLTHNPGYVIDWYDRRFGFDAGSGGWGSTIRDGRVRPPRGVKADKVRGLHDLERRFGVSGGEICHVGDAWPDARLKPLLGGFIALNAERADVREAADAVLTTRSLTDVLPILDRLRPRRPVKGAQPLDEDSNTRPRDGTAPRDGVRRPGGAARALA